MIWLHQQLEPWLFLNIILRSWKNRRDVFEVKTCRSGLSFSLFLSLSVFLYLTLLDFLFCFVFLSQWIHEATLLLWLGQYFLHFLGPSGLKRVVLFCVDRILSDLILKSCHVKVQQLRRRKKEINQQHLTAQVVELELWWGLNKKNRQKPRPHV